MGAGGHTGRGGGSSGGQSSSDSDAERPSPREGKIGDDGLLSSPIPSVDGNLLLAPASASRFLHATPAVEGEVDRAPSLTPVPASRFSGTCTGFLPIGFATGNVSIGSLCILLNGNFDGDVGPGGDGILGEEAVSVVVRFHGGDIWELLSKTVSVDARDVFVSVVPLTSDGCVSWVFS